jgi:quercetin dioxygenase-like cupin family protein
MKHHAHPYLSLSLLALAAMPSAYAVEHAPLAKDTVVLQRAAVPGTDRQLGLGIAEFPPNTAKPRHQATGPEVCYVLEGEVTVEAENGASKVYRAGESFQIPAHVVHRTSAGPTGAKVLASWVHTPGRTFNIAAPE